MNKDTFDINKIVRPHIINLKPYSSARDEYTGKEGVFLDANENPFGSVTNEPFNRYPDPLQKEVKQLLAKLKGVNSEQIFLGNGSDEAIDLLFRAFCEPKFDKVLTMPPTYGMYQVSADINLVETLQIPLNPDFTLNTEEVLAQLKKETNIKIVFICSPNNPSGNQLKQTDIEEIIQSFNGLVVVDEAYIDFATNPSLSQLLPKYPNLIVLQTFSKAWGMAALRMGMAFASKEIIHIINKIKPPYNINQLTQSKVLEALKADESRKQKVAEILALREKLAEELATLPMVENVYPSDANFLLVKMDSAHKTYHDLVEKLVIVRDRSKVLLCEDCLRITVGTQDENQKLLAALKALN